MVKISEKFEVHRVTWPGCTESYSTTDRPTKETARLIEVYRETARLQIYRKSEWTDRDEGENRERVCVRETHRQGERQRDSRQYPNKGR